MEGLSVCVCVWCALHNPEDKSALCLMLASFSYKLSSLFGLCTVYPEGNAPLQRICWHHCGFLLMAGWLHSLRLRLPAWILPIHTSNQIIALLSGYWRLVKTWWFTGGLSSRRFMRSEECGPSKMEPLLRCSESPAQRHQFLWDHANGNLILSTGDGKDISLCQVLIRQFDLILLEK